MHPTDTLHAAGLLAAARAASPKLDDRERDVNAENLRAYIRDTVRQEMAAERARQLDVINLRSKAWDDLMANILRAFQETEAEAKAAKSVKAAPINDFLTGPDGKPILWTARGPVSFG